MSNLKGLNWNQAKALFAEDEKIWEKAKGKGNRARRSFRNPHHLWCVACDYFNKTDETPIMKYEVVRKGPDIGKILCTPVARPYSWSGFGAYVYVNRIAHQLDAYRSNRFGNYNEYKDVLGAIGNIMFAQKFEHAAVGNFKENIIMADLKMKANNEESEEDASKNYSKPIVNIYTGGTPPLSSTEKETDDNINQEKDETTKNLLNYVNPSSSDGGA